MRDVTTPDAFESRLRDYVFERSEEARAVRVGEKETSEQAAIVARYASLFTRAQLAELASAEAAAGGDARERIFRLREACQDGIVAAELVERADALQNAILATRVTYREEELPLLAAQARLAVLDAYADRDELGELVADASARLNPERLELLRAGEMLEAELTGEPDPVGRSSGLKGVDLRAFADAVAQAASRLDGAYGHLRERWLDRILGPEQPEVPRSSHVPYLRRLSPLAATYTEERSVDVCLSTLAALGFDLTASTGIRLDLDDRPQKNPRACVIASDPPSVVHLITRAQGGIHDYQAFLHEAGHALHYAGCDPHLPYAFRRLARDHALTEIYSFLVESVTREPAWHVEHFGLDDATAEDHAAATRLVELMLFRRYGAKLRYELGFWSDFERAESHAAEYERLVTSASGFRYPASGYLADMDDGFYSADYLRAWVRAAQVRRHLREAVGAGWWRDGATGELLRGLFAEGTRPSSEEVAERLGYDPLDTAPLLAELSGAG
jgi:hypothetical protein